MEKVLKILAAVTGVLLAISDVLSQANKYVEYKRDGENKKADESSVKDVENKTAEEK